MCKVLVLTNMSKIKKQKQFINVVAKHISKTDDDGFGYAIQGERGLYGERSTNKIFTTSFDRKFLDFPFLKKSYNRFGEYSKPKGAGMFHGRTSTNDKTIGNTHPIQKHDWTLIHNGVVTNHGEKYKMVTTNDTEHLVHYMANGGLGELAKNLSGYYAAAAFDPDGGLHIFRDDRATLFWCEVESLETYVIGTTVELIESICKELKLKTSIISPLMDNTYVRLVDNSVVEVQSFEPRGATERENRFASLSLGEEAWPDTGYGTTIDATVRESRNDYSQWTESENLFFEEVRWMDHSFQVFDYKENKIDIETFWEMKSDEQLCCTVVRPDGTVINPENHRIEILYQGKVS